MLYEVITNFIVREKGSGTRELFENTLSVNEITWQAAWECVGSDILKSAALRGIGVAVISKRLVREELRITSYNVCYTKLLRLPEQSKQLP